jgi:predicted RNase H-like HicB family nuclease
MFCSKIFMQEISNGPVYTWQEPDGHFYCHWRHAPGCCALGKGTTKADAEKNAREKALRLWQHRES